jgi:predicted Zn-dependent protease
VRALASGGQIADARGSTETIGSWPAWVGNVVVNRSDGTRAVLAAAFVQRRSDQMFEIVGSSAQQGDALESQIFVSARSLRPLNDPARLAAKPDRVHVVRVTRSGPFEQVTQGLGPQAIDAEESSILNNVQRDENVLTGQLIKIVVPGKR